MADNPEILAQGIVDRLDDLAGPVVLTGALPVLGELCARLKSRSDLLPMVVSPLKLKRLRRLKGSAVIRSDPTRLPASKHSLAALVAVQALGRTTEAAQIAIDGWRAALASHGRIVLAEALSWSPAMRALTRTRLGPEDLTGLLINAGFVDIRQTWTRRRRGTVITTGQLQGL